MHPECNDEWEKLGRKMTWLYTLNHLEELEAATHQITGKIRDGDDVNADDIKEFRNALVGLQTVIEEDVSLLVDDVNPYQGALYHVLYGVFADYLDVPLIGSFAIGCRSGSIDRVVTSLELPTTTIDEEISCERPYQPVGRTRLREV